MSEGRVGLRTVGLAISLLVLWLLLSGYFKTLLLTLGVCSAVGVALIARRMEVVDHEGYPIHLSPLRVAGYGLWLAKEIVKSNLDVAGRIWSLDMRLSPALVKVRSTQKTRLGQVVFANSITLTPGTVSINLGDDEIEVHALTREGAAALEQGDMDRRVSALESE